MNGYTFLVCISCLFPYFLVTQAQDRDLGQSCSAVSQCSGTNTKCDNTCQCKDGYYDTTGTSNIGGQCNAKRDLGQSCTDISQCSGTNTKCDNTCQCKDGYYDTTGTSDIGGECYAKRDLGQSCTDVSQCSDTNTKCDNTCQCKDGYYDTTSTTDIGRECTAKKNIGVACTGIEQCATANAQCSGTCSCLSNYFQTDQNTCEKRSLDESCSADSHCSQVSNSECSGWTCSCKSDFYLSENTCTKRQLGQSCDATNQCSPANALCSSRICQCPRTYYDTTGSAISGACSLKVSLGGSCPQPTAALPNTATCSDTYARCTGSGSSYTCQCISTYYDNMDNTDRKCEQKVGLEFNCSRANACGTTNAGCVGGKCVCNSQYYDNNGLSNNGGNCVLRRSLGASCHVNPPTNADQCSDSSATCVWSSGSYKCICNRGYHSDGLQCIANKPLGQTCSVSTDCSDPAADCFNGKCTCGSNYYDDNGFTPAGTCVSVTNLQVTNVEFPSSSIKINEITITWSAPVNYKQYIDWYSVEWKRLYDNNIGAESQSVAASSTSLTLGRGLESSRAYTVTIISINDQTQSGQQRMASVTKQQAAKPTATSGLDWSNSDRDATTGTIKVAWVAAAGYVSQYQVELLDGTVIKSKIVESHNRQAEFPSSGLRDGYRYNVNIEAQSESYDSGKRVSGEKFTAEFKTLPQIPDPPRNGLCEDPTDKSITLKWSAPTDTKGDLVRYHIYVYQSSNTINFIVSTTGTGTQLIVGNLYPGTLYTFRIYTENEQYNSSSYNTVATGCRTKAKMSEPPTNLEITGITSRSFDVSWMKPVETYSAENYGYVLQIKDDQDKCVTEIVYICSDCTGGFQVSNLNGVCSVAVRQQIPKTKQELEGQMTYSSILNPDIAYTVTVTAINDAGRGYPANETETTLEEAPQRPSDVAVGEIETTSLKVTWNINGPRPGKTNFTIELKADNPAVTKEFIISGFDTRLYTAQGLEEFWNYSVTVTAATSLGVYTSVRTQKYTTKPAAPGKVSDFEITEAPAGNYTAMLITWKAPTILERNSIIESYSFELFATGEVTTTKNFPQEDLDHIYTVMLDVIPEETYTISVYAINEGGQKGEHITRQQTAPAGVPINIEDTLGVDIIPESSVKDTTQRGFTITIVPEFFTEDTYGTPKGTGLVACAKNCDFLGIQTVETFDSMETWKTASKNGFSLWRITDGKWLDDLHNERLNSRRKRSTTQLDYTVGGDDCSKAHPREYCNGPLQPDTSYILVAISCTNGGCLLSKEYGPFVTLAEQPSDECNCTTETIILGFVLGIINLLLLVYAGYATFLIRRYRANKDGPNMSKSNINDRKKQTYANTSFTESVGGRTDVESSRNIALSNEPDAEYSRLDDHTRDDRTTYDIIQCSR